MSDDRSRIISPVQDVFDRPIFGDTSARTLSSAALKWRGILVEEYHYSALEVPEMEMSAHVLDIQLSPALEVEWYLQGHYQNKRMVPGDICLFPCGPHAAVRWRERMDALVIALDPVRIAQVAYESVPPRGVELVTQRGGLDPQIQHIGMALKAEVENGGLGGPLYGESLGTALASHLLHRYNAYAPRSARTTTARSDCGLAASDLRRVMALIQDQLDVNLSLAEMAQTVNLSACHFARRFRQSTGMAPHQYVIAQRVEAARCLLLQGELSIGQIAARVGFASQSHLHRHFKRIHSISPTALLHQNVRTSSFVRSVPSYSKNVQKEDKNVEDDAASALA